jgi:hypothetical protein
MRPLTIKSFFAFLTKALIYWCEDPVLVKLKLLFSRYVSFSQDPADEEAGIILAYVANMLFHLRNSSDTAFSTVGMLHYYFVLLAIRIVEFLVSSSILFLVDCFVECDGVISAIVREMTFNADWHHIRMCMSEA